MLLISNFIKKKNIRKNIKKKNSNKKNISVTEFRTISTEKNIFISTLYTIFIIESYVNIIKSVSKSNILN